MKLTEKALKLSNGFFNKSFHRPGCLLRFGYYPPLVKEKESDTTSNSKNRLIESGQGGHRYGAHTDYDAFTLLQREEIGEGNGLEIMWDGEWVGVKSPPKTLTVNIGDLLARWTNDKWKATLHRVRSPGNG